MTANENGRTERVRIPIIAVTVFGIGALLVLAIGVTLYLGFSQAAQSTRQLWAEQSETLVHAMEGSLARHLSPIPEQARWVAAEINDLSDLTAWDALITGALAATPQLTGVALVRSDGYSRRWHRDTRKVVSEDWSSRPDIMGWLNSGHTQTRPSWRPPIWTETLNTAALLHDIPLRDETGNFIGMFSQIVRVSSLSHAIAGSYSDTGLTPFVLYDRDFVLVHPLLINEAQLIESTNELPLPSIETLGDVVLSRLWDPDEELPFISKALRDAKAVGVFWDDDFYLYVYRDINRYGPAPWTVGAYLNTTINRPGEMQRIMTAAAVGLAVLVLAVAAAIWGGHRLSRPIRNLANAAKEVGAGRLQDVPVLKRNRIRELDDAAVAFNAMTAGLRERNLIRATLGRFVPEEVASELLAEGGRMRPVEAEATILFCDIVAFTTLTESLGPARTVEVLNAFFSKAVEILERHEGVVTQFQGDAILATFNVPVARTAHAANAIKAALELLRAVDESDFAGQSLQIRIGINSGPVMAGAIGAEGRLNYTVHGDSVNLAARLESLNKQYGTHLMVSENTVRLADGFEFAPLGKIQVRGQTNVVRVYTVVQTGPQSKAPSGDGSYRGV